MLRLRRAYTLIEIMLVLGILSIAALGVWRLYVRGVVVAATDRTASSQSELVGAIRGEFAAASSFSGLTTVNAANAGAQGILMSGTQVVDGFGVPVQIAPATVLSADDAFGITFLNMTPQKCVAITPVLMLDSSQIFIGGINIQPVGGGKPIDGATISKACNGAPFHAGVGSVTFVYDALARPGSAAGASGPACTASCNPQTQTQTLACPGSEVGQVQQARSGTCVGAPCPSLTWGAWMTTSSSCAVAPTKPGAPGAPVSPTAPCSPATMFRTLACPAGDVGSINQQQLNTCVGGVPTSGPWTTISNDCVAPSAPGGVDVGTGCNPHVITGTEPCPAGEGGQIGTVQNVTCDASGNPVYGPVTPTSNTCQASCVATGTCCTVGTKAGPVQDVTCNAGQYGEIINDTTEYSTCSSATATPAWGTPQITSTSGSCANCPAAATATQTQNITVNAGCPAGYAGSDSWTQTQTRSQTTTYACPAGTITLPAPTIGAWSAWANTGGKIGEENSCTPSACSNSGGGVWSVAIISMQVGPIGGTPTSANDTVNWNPSTGRANMTTLPTTSRFTATGSIVFNLTVGGQTLAETVACTVGNSVLNSPGNVTTDECLYTGDVTLNGITLAVTVDAGGLPAEDHVNGSAVPVSIQATIVQTSCTATPSCANAGGPAVTVTPVDLTVDQVGDRGAVVGTYGNNGIKSGWTGSATVNVSYGGDTLPAHVTCTTANNTNPAVGGPQCLGPNTNVTLDGQVFGVNIILIGPTPSAPTTNGGDWEAFVEVQQNSCLHWNTMCNSIVTTNAGWGSDTNGKGPEIPVAGQITNSPVAVSPNGNGQSGDGADGNPWSVYCNMTGNPASTSGSSVPNPGYGTPTAPWSTIYNSSTAFDAVGNEAGYGAWLSQTCTMGQNRMGYSEWIGGGTSTEQVLYFGQSCSSGPVEIYSGPTGMPSAPSCPSSASVKVLGKPDLAAPPGCP